MKITTQRIEKDGEKYDLMLFAGRVTCLTHIKTGKSYTFKAYGAVSQTKSEITANGNIIHFYRITILYKTSNSDSPTKKIIMRYSFKYSEAFNPVKHKLENECNTYKRDEKRPSFIDNLDSLFYKGEVDYNHIFRIAQQRKEKILNCSIVKAKVLKF